MSTFIKSVVKFYFSINFVVALSFFAPVSATAAPGVGAAAQLGASKEQCRTRCMNQIDARTDAENTCTLKYGEESSQDKDNCILLETESNIRDCVKACEHGQ